jgi:Ca-activated chloride channel family protein
LKPFERIQFIGVSSLIVAMARPRTVDISSIKTKEGDIVMAVDVSGSTGERFEVNRMEAKALKRVAADFADERLTTG